MRRMLAFLPAIWFLACSASSVNTNPPETSQYAPVNEQRSDGEISYLNAGAKRVREARRENAYKKMHDHCGGDYAIVKEEDQATALGPQRLIWFTCGSAAPTAPKP
jgi:hypothetical protein